MTAVSCFIADCCWLPRAHVARELARGELIISITKFLFYKLVRISLRLAQDLWIGADRPNSSKQTVITDFEPVRRTWQQLNLCSAGGSAHSRIGQGYASVPHSELFKIAVPTGRSPIHNGSATGAVTSIELVQRATESDGRNHYGTVRNSIAGRIFNPGEGHSALVSIADG